MSSEPLCDDAPTVLITKEKLGFGLCHNPCIYLWLTGMFFFFSGLQKRKLPVLSNPLLQWERELRSFPSITGRKSWEEGGQRATKDPEGSEPGCFQRGAWFCLLSRGRRLFRNQGVFVTMFDAKQKATKRCSIEIETGERIIFAKTHGSGRRFVFKSFYFYSKADLSSSKANAHCSALVFRETLLRGSVLLVVQVLT